MSAIEAECYQEQGDIREGDRNESSSLCPPPPPLPYSSLSFLSPSIISPFSIVKLTVHYKCQLLKQNVTKNKEILGRETGMRAHHSVITTTTTATSLSYHLHHRHQHSPTAPPLPPCILSYYTNNSYYYCSIRTWLHGKCYERGGRVDFVLYI